MKKFYKRALSLAAIALSAGTLSSCVPQGTTCDFNYEEEHGHVLFWSSFGGAYSNILGGIVDDIMVDCPDLDVEHHSAGSYDKIKTDVMNSIATGDYPNVCVGYPDHFAEYIGNSIITPLDYYIDLYKQETGENLLDDYYEAYMKENMALDVDCNGDPVISALPFNKSTELMGYNGVFVDYCVDWCTKNATRQIEGISTLPGSWDLGNVPHTWQEWEVKGVYYKYILDTLTKVTNASTSEIIQPGKLVYGRQNYEGTASDFSVVDSQEKVDPAVTDASGRTLLLNFKDVDRKLTRVISWDSTDNMFITLVRQWGSEYTVLPEDQKLEEPFFRVGNILFNSQKNRAKTIECLKFFSRLNQRGVFGVPQTFNASYSSSAFEQNQVMFMLCSSGGLSYNTAKWTNRFRVAPLPYYKDAQGVVRKYVISQGADIAMTDAGARDDAFKLMVQLSTGSHQVDWCLKTGYYPASRKAAESQEYQDFLNEVEIETAKGTPEKAYQDLAGNPEGTRVAYREGSEVNSDYYMPGGAHFSDDGKDWVKFVDDAFINSSKIRTDIKSIFVNVFALKSVDVDNDAKYQKLLDDVCALYSNNPNVTVIY